MDDAALVKGTLEGCQEDFEVLVERYQKMIYAFVYRQLQDPDMTGDLVQATFVQAYTHLAGYRGEATFKTWLHEIALNQCRSFFRSRRSHQTVPIDELPEEVLKETRHDPERALETIKLGRLVGRLPLRQRTVVNLRVFSDLPFAEIARLEGITENSAKVNYHHAITRLKQWLIPEK